MSELIKKLNIKGEDDSLLIINSIYGFLDVLDKHHEGIVHDSLKLDEYNFILIFGTLQFELEGLAHRYIDYLAPGGVLWLAYPKRTSVDFSDADCSKGSLWNLLKDYDFEALRDISLTDDFNAIRYRSLKVFKVAEDSLEMSITETQEESHQ